MANEPVILGQSTGLARFDTRVIRVITLDTLEIMSRKATVYNDHRALEITPPSLEHDGRISLTCEELDRFAQTLGLPYNSDKKVYDFSKMVGSPVRAYYVHHHIVGWEPLGREKYLF